jgi:hypothetical protein
VQNVSCNNNNNNNPDTKAYCINMREKYDIDPGQSFGSLPLDLHEEYLSAQCYRYFCAPNKMAGKGKFKCKPLK